MVMLNAMVMTMMRMMMTINYDDDALNNIVQAAVFSISCVSWGGHPPQTPPVAFPVEYIVRAAGPK